jgi:hypothetical protein
MPVILTTPDEVETWMAAPAEEALKLQRPLPDGALKIVARGVKEDPAPTRRCRTHRLNRALDRGRPHAVLAGILISAGLSIIDYRSFAHFSTAPRADIALMYDFYGSDHGRRHRHDRGVPCVHGVHRRYHGAANELLLDGGRAVGR